MDEVKSLAERNRETLESLKGIDDKTIKEEEIVRKNSRNLLTSTELLFEKRRIYVEELEGDYFDYCMLTYDEMTNLFKKLEDNEDIQELNKQTLYMRLHKANPSITPEFVGNMPSPLINLMLKYINEEEERFLLPVLESASNTLKKMSQAVDSGKSAST